jgi:tetratricopeptide (TPR) repeat protein
MNSVQLTSVEPRRQNARTMLALYQKGRRYLTSRTNDGIRRSIECFQQVIEGDASCALAYAGLADSYSLGARYEVLPPQESWRKAHAAALDAVRIDCSLAEAHAALGFIELHYVRNTSNAEREFSAAIQLNPRYAPARQWYAWCLVASGRTEAGIENIRAALELDPLSPNAHADLALALYFSRRYKDSISESSKALQLAPGFYRSHQLLGLNFLQMGDYAKAIDQFHFAIASSGRNSRMLVLLAHAYAHMGSTDKTQLLANELTEPCSLYIPGIDFALLYSALEDNDRTFEYLEQAFRENEGELIWIPVDPIHDRIREDSRFRPFVERIGIGSAVGRPPSGVSPLSPRKVITSVTQ